MQGRMSLMNKFYDTFFHLCLGALNWLQNILCKHRSSGETVRDEHAKPVANYCLSVKIVRSCRDIGEMQ